MLRRRWDEAGTSTLGFSQLEGPRALLGGKRKSAGVAAELWMWHLHLSHNLIKWVTLETEDQRTHNSPQRHTNAQLFFDTFGECLVRPHQDFSMLMCSLQPEATPANELKQKPTDPIPRMRRVQPYYSLYKKKNPQCDTESEPKSQKTFFVFPKEFLSFRRRKTQEHGRAAH